MNAPPITFHCPACGTRLQIPASMAGVVGPCPRCSVTIQAPLPATVALQAWSPPAPPPVVAPAPVPAPAPAPAPPVVPVSAAAPGVSAPSQAAGGPAPLAPSPRELPNRGEERAPLPVVQNPWPGSSGEAGKAAERSSSSGKRPAPHAMHSRPRPRHSWFVRVGVPMLFIAACVAIFAATYVLLKPKPLDPSQDAVRSRPGKSKGGEAPASGFWPVQPKVGQSEGDHPSGEAVGTSEQGGGKPVGADSGEKPGAAAADPAVDKPSASGGQEAAPPVPVPNSPPPDSPPPASLATVALEKFLAAPDLAGRMDFLLTNRPPEELAASSLAGRLPSPAIPNLDNQVELARERLTEFHYTVTFPEAKPPHPARVKVIVHQRGGQGRPLVLADPFVDLFDGKIHEFGSKPVEGMRTFHVVAQAVPRCDSPDVPDAAKKFTVQILSNDGVSDEKNRPDPTRQIAEAYAGKLSPIGEMLNNADSGLRWGQAQPCVVTLQWNTSDDPQKPYLEIVRLDGLTWNR